MPNLTLPPFASRLTERFLGGRNANWVSPLLLVGLLLLFIWAIYRAWNASHRPTQVSFEVRLYFQDEETGETLIKTDRAVPPLIGKNGNPSVVQAVYQTNGDCNSKTLVYLRKYTDEAKAQIDADMRTRTFTDPMLISQAHYQDLLVRKPPRGSRWVKATSPEGLAIINSFPPPPNTPPKFCNPP